MTATATPTKTNTSDDELRAALAVQAPSAIEWLNLLVYGDPGIGKTYLLGTAEDSKDTSPTLIIDVEGGLITLRSRKIDVVSVRSMAEMGNIYTKLYHSIKNGKIYYKTIGIDSLTELASLYMRIIMEDAYQRNPDKVTKEVPSPREWGICREQIRNVVRAFRDLPCNVIYTAHAGEDQQEGQPKKYFPAFAGKLKTDVPGFMDIVGYLNTKKDQDTVVRTMQVLGTNRVVAKDRTGTLGDLVDEPNVPMLWNKINSA